MAGMVKLLTELTIEDLVSITTAIKTIRSDMNDFVCVGVQVPQITDKNVIFHMRGPKVDGTRKETIVMISTELILEKFGGTGNVAERNE
jgi:hypothetical protein